MGFFVAGWFAFGRLWSLPWGSSDWGRTGGVVLAAVFLLLVGCSFAGGAPEGCILGLDWGGAGVSFILALAGAAGGASTWLVVLRLGWWLLLRLGVGWCGFHFGWWLVWLRLGSWCCCFVLACCCFHWRGAGVGLLWVTRGPGRGGAPTAELVVVSLLVGGWVCWSVCFGLMWDDDDDNTTTNHDNKFCQQSTAGLSVGGSLSSCACSLRPGIVIQSCQLQLTFWITLWLITFELHSREHFVL